MSNKVMTQSPDSSEQQTQVPSAMPQPQPSSRRGGLWLGLVGALLAALAAIAYSAKLTMEHSGLEQRLLESQTALEQQKKTAATLRQGSRELSQADAKSRSSLKELQSKLDAYERQLKNLEEQRAAAEKEAQVYKELQDKLKKLVDSGKLEVGFRRGRMIVALPASVLFDSGEAKLSKEGQSALGEVAKVLAGVSSHRFIVAGHTDNVPVKKADFSSNWDLAASRAVNVTEELVRRGVWPSNLSAAGYAHYDSIGNNATEAGRQKNRRIEIVLEPDLSALGKTLGKGKKPE